MIRLMIEGPGGDSEKLDLEPGKTYILGRNAVNDIVLSDDTVSRKHARIETSIIGSMVVEDLDSLAGIYVNRKKVHQKTPVYHGDKLLIGKTFITVQADDHMENITTAVDYDEMIKLLREDDKIKTEKSNLDSGCGNRKLFAMDSDMEESFKKTAPDRFRSIVISLMMVIFLMVSGIFFLPDLIENAKENNIVMAESQVHPDTESESSKPVPTQKGYPDKIGGNDQIVSLTVTENQQQSDPDISNELLSQSVEYYIQGKYQMALKKLGELLTLNLPPEHHARTSGTVLIDQITRIHSLFFKGCEYYKNRQFIKAVDAFRYVLELDKEIVDTRSSYYSEQVFIYVVNSYYHIAKDSYEKEDFSKSRAYCERTLSLNPEHQGASKIKILLAGK